MLLCSFLGCLGACIWLAWLRHRGGIPGFDVFCIRPVNITCGGLVRHISHLSVSVSLSAASCPFPTYLKLQINWRISFQFEFGLDVRSKMSVNLKDGNDCNKNVFNPEAQFCCSYMQDQWHISVSWCWIVWSQFLTCQRGGNTLI